MMTPRILTATKINGIEWLELAAVAAENKIGGIYGIDDSRLKAICHSEGGHKIFGLVRLNGKKVRNKACEGNEIK